MERYQEMGEIWVHCWYKSPKVNFFPCFYSGISISMSLCTSVLGASVDLLQDCVQAACWPLCVELSFLGCITPVWQLQQLCVVGKRWCADPRAWGQALEPTWQERTPKVTERKPSKWAKCYGQDCDLEVVGAWSVADFAKAVNLSMLFFTCYQSI